ncbi:MULTISPECIES: cupin domain-containing protein [unclassified Cocleimonas]|uniref:cupin domain-containing protein n=2 Tax=Cocleimonas TaxID=998014 RepID=UPI002DD6A873|nr:MULTISPECIES: cupin domain-containing protein [unclassified Cocleimonas]
MTMSILGHISKEEFLRDYWQQKPLVIRGAFADFEMPFDAAELAGLACDTEAPSRIIVEKGLAPDFKAWTSKHSPFTDEDFINTPDSHWTFLVNDLERYVPELGNLIEPFRFIPDWRIDDLMVSYAADQGSVGPHVDEYDVFLIQGEGKRRWKINTATDYPKNLIPDTSLAILEEFAADEEWLLEKGDMLYLPPNMPHHGVAEGECFTFSVGFRAPSILEMSQSWIESFDDAEMNRRFKDDGRSPQENPGEINAKDLQALTDQIVSAVDRQKQNLPIFIGKYLTENRGEQEQLEDTEEEIADNQDYERQSGLRIAYTEDSHAIHLFASGNHLELPLNLKTDVQELCENFYYTSDSLKTLLDNNNFRALFQQLLSQGSVFPSE